MLPISRPHRPLDQLQQAARRRRRHLARPWHLHHSRKLTFQRPPRSRHRWAIRPYQRLTSPLARRMSSGVHRSLTRMEPSALRSLVFSTARTQGISSSARLRRSCTITSGWPASCEQSASGTIKPAFTPFFGGSLLKTCSGRAYKSQCLRAGLHWFSRADAVAGEVEDVQDEAKGDVLIKRTGTLNDWWRRFSKLCALVRLGNLAVVGVGHLPAAIRQSVSRLQPFACRTLGYSKDRANSKKGGS